MGRADLEWARIRVEDDVEIAYAQQGAGRAVVFVPGFTMAGEVFEHQLAALAPAYEATAIDPRGHGRSSDTASGNSYPQQGRDLAGVLRTLDLTDVNLVGRSYGALACYAYAEQFGLERLRSVTAIDQAPKPLGTGAPGEWADFDIDGALAEWVGPVVADPDACAVEFAAWLIDREPSEQEREWLTGMHLRTPRHVAECLLFSAALSDYSDLAASLGSEIAFANVIRDECLPEAQTWLSEQAPDAVLWTIPSHLGFWDSPAEFNERLVSFLETGR